MTAVAALWITRPAEPRDVDAIIWLTNRESNRIGHLPAAAISSFVDGRSAHVCEHFDHGVIGYIGGRPSLRYDRSIRPVTQLVVHPDHRRQGIATALVGDVMADAVRAGQSMLQAWSRVDLDARHLWEDLGWTAVAERSPQTARNRTAVLWRIPLSRTAVAAMWTPPPVGGYRAARSTAQQLFDWGSSCPTSSHSVVRSLKPATSTTAVT
jgi:GNAT superfamily N-acetyltransferase